MRTRVEACSGGVIVVVPQALAIQAGLMSGASVDVDFTDGQIVIRATVPTTLADLIASITPDNLHGEWAAEPPIGAELL